MRTPTIGHRQVPRADDPRRPGPYIVDQAGMVVVMGTASRYYVKARTRRPRNRHTGRIKF